MVKENTLRLICSKHGEQKFSAFEFAAIVLKCGCRWISRSDGLAFDVTLPYKERWWEQTEEERIKWAKCAYDGCKRRCVARYSGDYWCLPHLKRKKDIEAQQNRWKQEARV